jgi:cytochrome P450
VRPASEPIPPALDGSTAGKIFGALVRMNDGQGHCPLKKAISSTLDTLNSSTVFEISLRHAQTLAAQYSPSRLTDFAFELPAYVMASLLGVDDPYLSQIARWMSDFVYCLSPISTPQQIEQGKQAAERLVDLFSKLLAEENPTLLVRLSQLLSQMGITDDSLALANAIGFISQTYEATAGLIGNALLALAAHPIVHQQITTDMSLLNRFISEVARFDSPVQNTRRFLAADDLIAGQAMKAGDAVLVLLATANRDPAVNSQPDTFDIHRQNPQCFTFGLGIHACPGQSLAEIIARAALQHLITSGLDVTALPKTMAYRHSTNTRIPLLNQEKSL